MLYLYKWETNTNPNKTHRETESLEITTIKNNTKYEYWQTKPDNLTATLIDQSPSLQTLEQKAEKYLTEKYGKNNYRKKTRKDIYEIDEIYIGEKDWDFPITPEYPRLPLDTVTTAYFAGKKELMTLEDLYEFFINPDIPDGKTATTQYLNDLKELAEEYEFDANNAIKQYLKDQ